MKKIAILTALALSPTLAMASDDISYNAFIKYRNFGAKKGVTSAPDIIIADPIDGGKGFFPSINSYQMSYFGNVGRTVQDAIAMGDWNSLYRVTMGYEHNYTNVDNSSSTYGSDTNTGNLFVNADKLYSKNVRLGAGIAAGYMDADYSTENMNQEQASLMSFYYLTYKNKEYDILHRSIAYLGYGKTDLRRVSATETHHSDFSSLYYGLENIVYKNFKAGSKGLYVRPAFELNYYGISQEGFRESGNGFDLPYNSSYKVDMGLQLYVGLKHNKFDLRAGYDWTALLSDPAKSYNISYYDGTSLDLEKRTSDRTYGTWRASFSYKVTDDTSFVSDIRYYDRSADNIMFTLGFNFGF